MSGLFRCAGDILFDDNQPMPGQISSVQLKKFSETSNFLQYKHPLTQEHPYFFAQIRSISQQGKITIGIAGHNIDNDAHPGHWNNTVGYHSDTGKCFTSHSEIANTKGEKFYIGDIIGVLISHFGDTMSTVMFLKNGAPVATRYLFESDHCQYLPTICLENGPIDLGLMWPQAAMGSPTFDERNMLNWIKEPGIQYDMSKNTFSYDRSLSEVTIQSPMPLTRDLVHYEVIVQDIGAAGESPAVGLATCSPLKPSPTCPLLRDYFRWKADGKELKVKAGDRIGFGIHYNPDEVKKPTFSDKDQQLVLCFVTLDMQIVFFKQMLQPPGGFYPLVILCRGAWKVKIDVESNRGLGDEGTTVMLDSLYREKYEEAMSVFMADFMARELKVSMFRKSADVQVETGAAACVLRLPAARKRIHVVQFQQPLTLSRCFFCAEIVKLNEDSVVSLGVADSRFPLNKHPGKLKPSTGWVSRDGKMYFNERCNGHIEGERFNEGDTVALEVLSIGPELSVVLFIKNDHPIGTRYVSMEDPAELLPTISLCGNGYDVELYVYWQNRISTGPNFSIPNIRDWCKPEDCQQHTDTNTVTVKDHLKPVALQCPYPLTENFNHFEVKLLDVFGGDAGIPPPVLALSAACARENIEGLSNFRIDYLRFWPVGEAEQSVSVGDLVGWGMFVPPSEVEKSERLVICYLTINRDIALMRVLYEPPGGLFPLVILPTEVNRVKFEFSALVIVKHPLSDEIVNKLISDAQELIEEEREAIQTGRDIDDLRVDPARLLRPMKDFLELFPAPSEASEQSQARLSTVVMQARGMNSVQKAIQMHKDKGQSRACVIL